MAEQCVVNIKESEMDGLLFPSIIRIPIFHDVRTKSEKIIDFASVVFTPTSFIFNLTSLYYTESVIFMIMLIILLCTLLFLMYKLFNNLLYDKYHLREYSIDEGMHAGLVKFKDTQ